MALRFTKSICLLVVGLLSAILPAANGAGLHRHGTSQESAITIPFRDVGHELVVTFSLNGHKGRNFLIDTNSGKSFLDSGAAKAAHVKTIPLHARLNSPVATVDIAEGAPHVRVEGYGLGLDNGFFITDLDPLSQRFGIPVAGVIGYDFLAQFPFLVDYSAKTITIFPPKDTAIPFVHGIEIPLEPPLPQKQYGPAVSLDLELPDGRRMKAKLSVDTGSLPGLVLHLPFLQRNNLHPAKDAPAVLTTSYGGTRHMVRGTSPVVLLGDLRLSSFETVYAIDPIGMGGSTDFDGEIGNEILSRFRVYMDAPHQRVVFEPIKAN